MDERRRQAEIWKEWRMTVYEAIKEKNLWGHNVLPFMPTPPPFISEDYKFFWNKYEQYCRTWYNEEAIEDMIMSIIEDLKLPLPFMAFDLDWKSAGGCFTLGLWTLRFPKEGATGYIILHELAHYIEALLHGSIKIDKDLQEYKIQVNGEVWCQYHSEEFKVILDDLYNKYKTMYIEGLCKEEAEKMIEEQGKAND